MLCMETRNLRVDSIQKPRNVLRRAGERVEGSAEEFEGSGCTAKAEG